MSRTNGSFGSSDDETPTDEIELPQQPSDRTRAVPYASEPTAAYAFGEDEAHEQPRQDAFHGDAPTVAFPKQQETKNAPQHPAPSSFGVAGQVVGNERRGGYGQGGAYGQQPAFMPHPEDLRKGPSAGARFGSVMINLLLTVGIVLLLLDWMRVRDFGSVVANWFIDLDISLLQHSLLIPIGIGLFVLFSGITLALSGLGAGLLGSIILLFSVIAVLLPDAWVSGGLSEFLYVALPLLIPLSLMMVGGGIGAHFARRAGAKRMVRAYTGRL